MKPFLPIHGALACENPMQTQARGKVWTEPPHVCFANVQLDEKSLLAFDRKYGALLLEHLPIPAEIEALFRWEQDSSGVLTPRQPSDWTEGERRIWETRKPMQPAVTESDVHLAQQLQSYLRGAWKGNVASLTLIEHGGPVPAAQGPYTPIQLKPTPSERGIILYAKDSWNLIRAAFLLDYKQGRMRICQNPECPAPYFLAKRKTQRYCERGACTAYAQRRYALGYWNRKGRQQRAKLKASTRRAKRYFVRRRGRGKAGHN